MEMETVEQALLLSGYRIKIENKDEPAYNGKLYVTMLLLVMINMISNVEKTKGTRRRHRVRGPPSPPPIPDFSEREATGVNKKFAMLKLLKRVFGS
ncbi:hypothetical protein TNCT_311071 [Trichonephila clavata]|uniref:Uncharacterized protein n=1 Tax=Trichonephila clavata TaxID=2740835 RepID=A0A8X6LDN1_TRICU|nr:hypothetical protein TNCT_311071 [Trichonephila clavata]